MRGQAKERAKEEMYHQDPIIGLAKHNLLRGTNKSTKHESKDHDAQGGTTAKQQEQMLSNLWNIPWFKFHCPNRSTIRSQRLLENMVQTSLNLRTYAQNQNQNINNVQVEWTATSREQRTCLMGTKRKAVQKCLPCKQIWQRNRGKQYSL